MTEKEYLERKNHYREVALRHLESGVEFFDIDSVYIDDEVTIGKGTVIGPCVTLRGRTSIGENCRIYQNTRISDSLIHDEVTVQESVILSGEIGNGTSVGPFAYIRPGTNVGENCRVGDFVEIKNSTIGNGTKSSHLTYIGDADIGRDVNIGCGVVFVNYDGRDKHRSTVGDNAFIGCNTNLISPVEVGDGAYIAAGTTVNKDIPDDALAIGRAKQENKENWAKKAGLYRK